MDVSTTVRRGCHSKFLLPTDLPELAANLVNRDSLALAITARIALFYSTSCTTLAQHRFCLRAVRSGFLLLHLLLI